MLRTIALCIVSSTLYSLLFYAKQRDTEESEKFNPYKFSATLTVGILVGLTFTLSGTDITTENFLVEMSVYASTISVVEGLFKWAARRLGIEYSNTKHTRNPNQ